MRTPGGQMGRALDVLIHGQQDRIAGLIEPMARLALTVRPVRHDTPRASKPEDYAASIIFANDAEEFQTARADLERIAPGRRSLIAVGPNALKDADGADAWIPEPATPAQLAARVRALFRLDAMERIAERRKAATALYGERVPNIDPLTAPANVLYVGDASPRFMSLVHVMEEVDADVVAAFSSYSAFDYLHERSFDAVVLNAAGNRDMAFTISSAMRRNARLYHTPILLLTGDEDAEAAEEAFARGVSDILTASTDDVGMRERVMTLAAERRRRRDAKALLEACRDPRTLEIDTGLFHAGFVTSHIQDLLNVAETGEISFAVLALEAELPDGIERPDDLSAEKARRQFAAMLRHLLRAEDAAARLNASTFLAVLPFTEPEGVDCVAARVSAIAECTAFESEDPLQPFRLSVHSRTIVPRPGETAEALMERAVRALQTRTPFARQA